MKIHPVAEIFPTMSDAEFQSLKADIAEHGIREPIWTWHEYVIDGRHRLRASGELMVKCPMRAYHGDEASLVGFVVSLNLKRRHLDESQRAMVAANIARLPLGANQHTGSANLPTQAAAASMLNVSERTVRSARQVREDGAPELVQAVEQGRVSVSAAADVAMLPKPAQAQIVARGEAEILQAAKAIRAQKAEARRTDRIERINEIAANNAPLAEVGRRFPVLYCDPPWRYEHIETESRAIENQYPTMSLDDICAMSVSDIAHDDAVLFMWVTSPKLEEGMRVLAAWGFTYRTCAVWDKEIIGMGYYFRQQHELLLVASRGALPVPLPANRPSSVLRERRNEHSAKPHIVYDMIEAMYPEFDKVELFARNTRSGWHAWGNQSRAA
jgi:N6-adenosine-specific RNA methylase IME4/ParB-like chromosome segregation protein Spo0J